MLGSSGHVGCLNAVPYPCWATPSLGGLSNSSKNPHTSVSCRWCTAKSLTHTERCTATHTHTHACVLPVHCLTHTCVLPLHCHTHTCTATVLPMVNTVLRLRLQHAVYRPCVQHPHLMDACAGSSCAGQLGHGHGRECGVYPCMAPGSYGTLLCPTVAAAHLQFGVLL